MLNFLIGVIVGGIIGFLVCAVLSINSAEKESKRSTHVNSKTGDSDDRK